MSRWLMNSSIVSNRRISISKSWMATTLSSTPWRADTSSNLNGELWRSRFKRNRPQTVASRVPTLSFSDASVYRLFPNAAVNEMALEASEGIAEYTGVRLGMQTPEERTRYALRDLSTWAQVPSFVRSFAYATGP